jgi:hypothetical protein
MKKVFILLAIGLGFSMSSCKSVEDKTIDCYEELYEAVVDNDADDFRECASDFCEWYQDLNYKDQEEAKWVEGKWAEKNEKKYSRIIAFIEKYVPCETWPLTNVVDNGLIQYIHDLEGYRNYLWNDYKANIELWNELRNLSGTDSWLDEKYGEHAVTYNHLLELEYERIFKRKMPDNMKL